jgi:hypothetical protein
MKICWRKAICAVIIERVFKNRKEWRAAVYQSYDCNTINKIDMKATMSILK